MRRLRCLRIGLLSVVAVGLSALCAPAQQAEQEPTITTTFRCVSWDGRLQEPLYVRVGGEAVRVDIHSIKRSAPVEYVGPDPVVFHRKVERTNAAGETEVAYKPVAEARVGPEVAQPLFFFVRSGNRFKVVVLEDSFDVYPLGSYRFYNFTEDQLMAKLGTHTLTLDPGEVTYLEAPFDGNIKYPVLIVVREPDGLKPLYSNQWTHNSRYRYLVLVSESGSRDFGPIQFRSLADYP